MEIIVPARKIPVMAECDLLVCGAGPAGCAAAISAARSGLKTVLVERWSFPGGMGTAGLVNIFHTSDREKQVIFGILQELIERGLKKNYCRQYENFSAQHETHEFDPEGLKVLYEEMLSEAKINLLYTLAAGDVIAEGETIKAVLCDTKTGRKAFVAKIFIDATGDGDLAAKAGVPFDFGRSEDGLVQGMTLMYKLMDIDREKALAMTAAEHKKIIDRMKQLAQEGRFPPFGPVSFRYYAQGGHPNMCPVAGNPLDEASLTRCNIKARKQIEAYLEFFKEEVPGFKNVKIAASAASLGIRESRRIKGLKTLTGADVVECKKQADAVGHGFWMIDIHDPKGSGRTIWEQESGRLPAGQSYHIPYLMMAPVKFSNLLVAGRCASSTHEAHASVRLMSHCIVMGQGAGTAAGIALDTNTSMANVNIPRLQKQLRDNGVYIRY